jgi:DNA-directed RNA polymerase subunit alpha
MKALESIEKAHGASPAVFCQRGMCLEDEGKYDEAMGEYEKALELESSYAPAAFRLAWQHGLRGDDDEAIRCYRRCTQDGNFYVSALMNLGILYEDQGSYHEAHRCFLSVLAAHPLHKEATMHLKDVEASFHMKVDDDFLRRPDGRMRLLETPITEFELSARSRNCLESMGIATLGDLVSKTEAELIAHRNFGETSLAEVKQLLRSKELELGQQMPSYAPAVAAPRLPGDEADILNKPLSELDMSARARKCVDTLHLQTLGDLADKSERELLQCRNVGVTTVEELKKKLAMFSLGLRKEA